MGKIDTIIFGCGVMGRKIAEALLKKETFGIVGAIDIESELLGKDLGQLFEMPTDIGIPIQRDTDVLRPKMNAQAAILSTTSHIQTILQQIVQCINAGLNVVSTCEELSYPWERNPELAQKIDDLAKKHGVTVVGTGINPGYLMDTLPLFLTAPCLQFSTIKVTRMMNSSKRRIPFQKKVGTGLTKEEFKERIEQAIITGHVGLLESVHMIAAGLGLVMDEVIELPPEPFLAETEIESGLGIVRPGEVIGLKSVAIGRKDGRQTITLEFIANAEIKTEYDEILIEGTPNIHQRILGGVHGDIGTVAVTLNTIPKAVASTSGLRTMKDLPIISAVL
jgi:4-hydroxy-tetrahydrodipicolinate reductase